MDNLNEIASEKDAPKEARLRKAWRESIAKTPLPKKGTFEASYPDKEWREVKYSTELTRHPMLPRRGPMPTLFGGNGNNVSAQAPMGLMTSANGSFDSLTGVTSVSGQVNGAGPAVANAYTLQLNTNRFSNPIANSPTGCEGWQQFVLQNDGGTSTTSLVYIQYWLLNYGTTSPGSGWIHNGSSD
jgi:hypothetical protein